MYLILFKWDYFVRELKSICSLFEVFKYCLPSCVKDNYFILLQDLKRPVQTTTGTLL